MDEVTGAPAAGSSPPVKKLVVAVHGMGDMKRGDFAQTLARVFARHHQRKGADYTQVTRLPAGAWSRAERIQEHEKEPIHRTVSVQLLPREGANAAAALWSYAFAEVYWADLPRVISREGYTVEELTSWARSVVGRVRHRYDGGSDERFRLAATVVEEIAETIPILMRLCGWAEKAGIFRFDLGWVLMEYLGDVQIVADFPAERRRIVKRFCEHVSELVEDLPDLEEVHIVAHSEGTVVSFLALLEALRRAEGRQYAWIEKVRSYTTFGSPLDKHVVLFPEIFAEFASDPSWRELKQPIRWFNYYDYADPVGFELDTTYGWLEQTACNAFKIERATAGDSRRKYIHDFGFRRYPLPGKAHIDYFDDDKLFEHVIQYSIDPQPDAKGGPAGSGATNAEPAVSKVPDSWLGRFSRVLPFLIVALLLLAGVFTFNKALPPTRAYPVIVAKDAGGNEISRFTIGFAPGAPPATDTLSKLDVQLRPSRKATPTPEPAAERVQEVRLPSPPQTPPSAEAHSPLESHGLWAILAMTALLFGTTVLGRVWRLTKEPRQRLLALTVYVGCAALFCAFHGPFAFGTANTVQRFEKFLPETLGKYLEPALFCALSLLLIIISLLADKFAMRLRKAPVWGLRVMMIAAALIVGWLIKDRLLDDRFSAALILSAAAVFLYLWWLSALIFDLVYVWSRYINQETSIVHHLRPKDGQPAPLEQVSSLPIFKRYPE